MTSYAKKMSGLAAQWIAANPDQENKFIRPPAGIVGQQDIEQVRARLVSKAINTAPSVGAGKGRHGSEFGLELCRWLLAWGRSGRNAFDLSADFVAAMLLTDPDTLDISTARIPFPGILVTIPDGFAVGAEGGQYTKIHAWEVTAQDVAELTIGDRIRNKIDAAPRGTLPALAEAINGTPDSATIGDLCNATGIQDDGGVYRAMLCIVATDGAHSLTTFAALDDISWPSIDALPEWSNADESNETDRRAQRTIRQVVFGMLAYINAVDGAVTPRPVNSKRDKRERSSSTAPADAVTYFEVGRNVRIDPQLVAAARDGSRDVALRIKHRFIVRGHYRNQAHGPSRSERTMRWIAPFWKGPDDGARIVHTYRPVAP